MRRIYLDNASTSFPKAPHLSNVVKSFLDNPVSLFRTESDISFTLFSVLENLREGLAKHFNAECKEAISFTLNVTEALNTVISGLLYEDDHVIVSSNEHNAVMRALNLRNIKYSRIPSDSEGYNIYDNLEAMLTKQTKALVINAAGNVSGALQDLTIPSYFAKKHSLYLIIDTAQSSPFVKIDMKEMDITAICFTGHKGFLGPQGTGGLILNKECAENIKPLITGGTGSESDSESVPRVLPDRLSGGTPNYPGLVGLEHSFSYTMKNFTTLYENERKMTEYLYDGLKKTDKIKIVGAPLERERTNVISIVSECRDIAEISYELLKRANIETRVGLHCSPSSHKSLNTFPGGTLRFSPGPFTTKEEIDETLYTLKEILK